MAESDEALAECLVYLMQAHVQKYGPLPDAVGDALKAALSALLPAKFCAKESLPKPTNLPDYIVMVLKRRDGFEMRMPCPYREPPYMWIVPERPRMASVAYSLGDSGEYPTLRETRFVRGRRLSETEVEYLEE